MRPECTAAVQAAAKALGRKPLSAAQIKAIDDRISAKMRELARTDPDWQTKPADQRVTEAAQLAQQDMAAEAARKVENAQRQLLATTRVEQRITTRMGLMGESRSKALIDDLDQSGHYINGIKQESMGRLMSLMDATKSGDGVGVGRRIAQFLFDADNPVMTRDLAHEIFDGAKGSTGNKVAVEGAKAWLEVIEGKRQRFNNAGGDVGKLDYGYLPQPHDAARIRAAGRDAWVAKMLPLIDRSRYVLEDGARMGDAEVQGLLRGAWETLATEGLNKQTPGQFKGSGAKANAGSESRQLHFKDADSYLAYSQDFGAGSMYDAMLGHIGRMSRDIGLVERYGPNPAQQMRVQFDLAERVDGGLQRDFGLMPQSYWDQLNGTAGTPQSARIAQVGTDVRNMQTFGKLGGAVISSITDLGTFMVTTGYNKLPYWDAFTNYVKGAASKDTRDFMTAHGIIADSMIGDMQRWTGDNIRQNWSGRLANSTMKLSLMNAWTDTLRRAFSLTMMQGMARLSKTDWGNLGEWDRTHLQRKGITEDDWSVITRADLTDFQGKAHLTPEAIRATGDARSDEVVAKVLGLIQDESEYAVINPDLATKAMASAGGTQRGTIRGELARSVMQFKSFPIAMVSRHWRRVLDAPKVADGSAPVLGNRLAYAGALMVTTTALGAIALQGKQMVQGKDPIDMTGEHAVKFWAKATAQGGGLSIAGDLLLNDPASSYGDWGANLAKTFAGPAFGTAADALKIATVNTWNAAKGKETHAAAQSVQLARANTPLINIWYAKAAVDHAGMHALQENLSPGYLSKMKQRTAKEYGQGYWWAPGTGAPDRAPDIGKAVGQ